MVFATGDLVTRKSYEHDILFQIVKISNDLVILHGVDLRLIADAGKSDLTHVEDRELQERRKRGKEKEAFSYRLFRQDYQLMEERRSYAATSGYTEDVSYFRLPIKVLHLDGDQFYLKKCIELYKRLGIQVHGKHVNEKEMPDQISELIEKIQPDILVITGHDSYSKSKGEKKDIRAYRHSSYFTETVRAAREKVPSLDQLIIFAGACQSHFESLIRAGANFASSPERVNIHALDPVYIAAKIAYTPFMDSVNVWNVVRNTLTGDKGLGGIETKGLHRVGMPYIDNDNQNIDSDE